MTDLRRRLAGSVMKLMHVARTMLGSIDAGPVDASKVTASQNDVYSFTHSTGNIDSGARVSMLVVSDKDENWFLLKSLLPDFVDVRRSNDGRSAVDALVAHRPDLILIDLAIAVIGGLDTLREIRRLQTDANETKSIIYALGNHDDRTMALHVRQADFDGILCTPLCPDELYDVLRMVASGISSSHTAAEFWIDKSFVETFPSFIESRLSLIDQMASAFQRRDLLALKRAAHTLAGSPALNGFNAGIAICRKINQMTEIQDGVEVEEQLKVLRSFFICPIIL